ncbi:MAG: hypothetical protein XXXJIFNMEKO3_02701 [Candidatus Erwinia impunctatus]
MNCSGGKIVFWRIPLVFDNGSPGQNLFTIYYLINNLIIAKQKAYLDVFEAVFLQDGDTFYLGTGGGYNYYLHNGDYIGFNQQGIEIVDSTAEKNHKPTS